MSLQGLILYFELLQGSFIQYMPLHGPLVHQMPLQGPFVYQMPLLGTFFFFFFFLSCTSSGVSIFICVLLFRGVTYFEPIGLPRFRPILDSFSNCPSGTLIRAGAFAAEICDFVTFFASTNASGN